MYQGGIPEEFILTEEAQNGLVNGENVLAIQVHNTSVTSSDMSAIAFLSFGIGVETFSYRPTPDWFVEPLEFKTSFLPMVIIETQDRVNIPDEPKVKAHMKIIHHGPGEINQISDPGNVYDGNIGIEIRGAYSASLPQKPFGIETRNAEEENLNVSLLGMPEENDWILLANYNDKVFMRNTLAFHLFRQMGHYAPRAEFCEVSLNGSYEGIYVFTERIKRDKGRVDIAKLDKDDNRGDNLTGGYIFKVDYYNEFDSWKGSYSPIDNRGAEVHYVYSDPKYDELTMEQKAYLQDFVKGFESNLYSDQWRDPEIGYASFIDAGSFVDYFIIGELTRNVDAYKKSRYYFKDRDSKGGLIHSGPVWDFDWAWKNLPGGCVITGPNGGGWAYRIGECGPWPSPSGWMVRLMRDPYFKQLMANRYWELRGTILSDEYLVNYIDSVNTIVEEAQVRHYMRWPTLGTNVGAPEIDEQPLTFEGEITKFKNWIKTRLTWLDANMPIEGDLPEPYIEGRYISRLFPNPAAEYVYVESDKRIKMVEVYNAQGMLMVKQPVENVYSYKMDLPNLERGIYFLSVTDIFEKNKTLKLVVM
jgi:hypothetical protein